MQAARNYHAMLAARALSRVAGVLGGRLATPACTAARQGLAALLTPSLAGRLTEEDPKELLQQLNGSVCTPQVCCAHFVSTTTSLRSHAVHAVLFDWSLTWR